MNYQKRLIPFIVIGIVILFVGITIFIFRYRNTVFKTKSPILTISIYPTQNLPTSSASPTPSSLVTSGCSGNLECPSGLFCDYGYNCAETPEGVGCTKIYSGSKRCIKKCSTNNDCPADKVCKTYYVASGSDIALGQKGCQ